MKLFIVALLAAISYAQTGEKALAQTCVDDDATAATSFASMGASSCADVASFCTHATYGSQIASVCCATCATASTTKYWVGDGCENGSTDLDGEYMSEDELANVRCCSSDGSTCFTYLTCDDSNVFNYASATAYCANQGLRLCTKLELQSQICCGTGGQCNSRLVWTSTVEVDEYWVDDGCHTESDNTPDDFTGGYYTSDQTYGIRCCAYDGSSCDTTHHCQNDQAVTYSEASQYCASENKRLCTRTEMESGICCSTGGKCDSYQVWTSSKKGKWSYIGEGQCQSSGSYLYHMYYFNADYIACATDCETLTGCVGISYDSANSFCKLQGASSDYVNSIWDCGSRSNCGTSSSSSYCSSDCKVDGDDGDSQFICWAYGDEECVDNDLCSAYIASAGCYAPLSTVFGDDTITGTVADMCCVSCGACDFDFTADANGDGIPDITCNDQQDCLNKMFVDCDNNGLYDLQGLIDIYEDKGGVKCGSTGYCMPGNTAADGEDCAANEQCIEAGITCLPFEAEETGDRRSLLSGDRRDLLVSSFMACGEPRSDGGFCLQNSDCDTSKGCFIGAVAVCSSGGSNDPCWTDSDCDSDHYCLTVCIDKLSSGKFCAWNSQCKSGDCLWYFVCDVETEAEAAIAAPESAHYTGVMAESVSRPVTKKSLWILSLFSLIGMISTLYFFYRRCCKGKEYYQIVDEPEI